MTVLCTEGGGGNRLEHAESPFSRIAKIQRLFHPSSWIFSSAHFISWKDKCNQLVNGLSHLKLNAILYTTIEILFHSAENFHRLKWAGLWEFGHISKNKRLLMISPCFNCPAICQSFPLFYDILCFSGQVRMTSRSCYCCHAPSNEN